MTVWCSTCQCKCYTFAINSAGRESVKDLLKFLKQQNKTEEFDGIRIGLASPDMIRSWSFGEVKKPETINYRTLSLNVTVCSVHVFLVQ